jgi:CheY-specific phosphatase CheX
MTPIQQSSISLQASAMAEMLSAATRDLFTSMLGLEVEIVFEGEAMQPEPFDGVMSLIGFTGQVVATGGLKCSGATACDLSSRFLMAEFPAVDEQVLDAVGEMTNMIVGGFKTLLEAQMGRLHMSIPSVIHGKNLRVITPTADVTVAVRATYSHGQVHLRIGLAASRD